MTAFTGPNIKWSTPISVTRNTPVLNVFKPVSETTLTNAFGNPINSIVVTDKVILNVGHLDKPRFTSVVDKWSVTTPAVGVVVFKLRSVKE